MEAASRVMKVERTYKSPDFITPHSAGSTLMLLKLAEKINWADHPNIRPVCLPTRTDKLYTGATATVAGWGDWYKDVFGPGGYPEGLISRDPTNKALQELDMTVMTTEVQFCWSPAEVATVTLDYTI